ncbi:MAG: hypothetical protein LC687_06535 [Actinobacteria bacterium]|nr:hypothetical protein [Actinomycetota bacterium]MCA1807485.1 hypothetical protein [Actinomycetota bacterium]
MQDQNVRFRQTIALSAQIYDDKWSTHSENYSKMRARNFAIMMRMKEQEFVKPPRKQTYDGDIAKRRDRS